MNGPLVLIAHSLKRIRTLVLTMGILLAAFQVLLVAVAKSIESTGGFSKLSSLLPPFVRDMMGPAFAAFMSFAGIVSVGYFHLSVMGSLVGLAIAIATVPASEVESGFIDLLLSRPLARHWIVTRSVVSAVLSIALILGLMILGTWIGLVTIAPATVRWPSVSLIRALAGNLAALLLCWTAIGLAIASASRRRSVAGGLTGVLALSMFLLDYVGRLWRPAESVAWLSPFRYYSPFDMVLGGRLPLRNVMVLAGISIVSLAVAYVVFSRRDISH